MRATLLTLLAFTLLGLPAAAQDAPRLGPGQPIPPAELEAFVDGYVEAAMAENNVTGVAVSVVQDGQVLLTKGYGFADVAANRRVDPDATLFRIGSITKTFTWILLMNEVEAGRVGLDDPVNDHLPAELAIPEQGFAQPIRVRDLMTHSPGFEDRALGVLFVRDAADIRPLTQFLRETRPDRVREPGLLSSYSNYGAALAGAIVEHEAGRPWQDMVESEILSPLGMSRTSPREPYPAREGLPAPMAADLADDVAVGYRRTGANAEPQPFEHVTQIGPAGVMSSTASDMTAYMLMLLGDGQHAGRRIFGPAAARAFREPMTALPANAGNWAAGFAARPASGAFMGYGHNGATLTHFSNMIVIPELRLGVFATTNTVGGGELVGGLPSAIVERFYVAGGDPPAGAPHRIPEMRAYAGGYLPTRREHGGLAGMIHKLRLAPVSVTPEGYLNIAAPGSDVPLRFAPTDTPGVFRSVAGPNEIVFEERDGRMTLLMPGMALERVDNPLAQPQLLSLIGMLALLASAAAIVGGFVRLGRGLPATAGQRLADRLQVAAAALWILATLALVLFGTSADERLVFTWPNAPILTFSTAALLASLLALGGAATLPAVWRGGAAVGWRAWRKSRFTATAAIFLAFAALLLSFGALQPWNP